MIYDILQNDILQFSFSKDSTDSLFPFRKVGSINLLFLAWLVISDLYLFQLFFPLKPVFHCCNNIVLSGDEKLNTGTQSFIFGVAKVGCF